MTKEISIEEGNKIIAEFDGVTFEISDQANYPENKHEYFVKFPNGACFKRYGELNDVIKYCKFKYHSSWDWLMPVVEEIEGLQFSVVILRDDCSIYDNSFRNTGRGFRLSVKTENNKISATWQAVIQFIQWYNKNTQQ